MEQLLVATINWKDSKFEKDEIYEHINAPQWLDLSSPTPYLADDSFFCRSDCNCNHLRTADDLFIKTTPNSCKPQRSANLHEIPPTNERNQSPLGCTTVKKKATPLNKMSKTTKYIEDSENQNPNNLAPTDRIKSSTEKKKAEINSSLQSEETPRRLRSTFSAHNLFAGNNILNQITDFCNELKRLATRRKERVTGHEEREIVHMKHEVGVLQEIEIQKKPLLEATKAKHEVIGKNSSNGKEKLPRKNVCRKNNGLVEGKQPIFR